MKYLVFSLFVIASLIKMILKMKFKDDFDEHLYVTIEDAINDSIYRLNNLKLTLKIY